MSVVNYPLSNVQIELMKLFSTNLSDEELMELKDMLAKFYADKATSQADTIWNKRGLSNEDMDKWLNQQS